MARITAILMVGAAAVALAGTAPAADEDTDYKARFDAAVTLHERGQYDAAIGAFRDLLATRPNDAKVLCELANSQMRAGKNEEAKQSAGKGLALPGADRAFCSNVLGSALDGLGDHKQGEKVFRKAIKQSPDVAFLRYNYGINLGQQGRLSDAMDAFQESIRLDPAHASSWRALSITWFQVGLRPRAFAGFARFLTLEPAGARAEAVAKQLRPLLFRGVENRGADASGKQQINVSLDPDALKRDEVTGSLELGMSTVAAGRWTEEWQFRSDDEFFAHAFESVMAIFGEMDAPKGKEGAFWRDSVLPYFRDARAAGHLEAMAWDIRRSLQDQGTTAWLEAHAGQVEKYRAWSSAWKPGATTAEPAR